MYNHFPLQFILCYLKLIYLIIYLLQDENGAYYPATESHEQNFAYLIIDPLKRHINVLYHKFGSPVFGS